MRISVGHGVTPIGILKYTDGYFFTLLAIYYHTFYDFIDASNVLSV